MSTCSTSGGVPSSTPSGAASGSGDGSISVLFVTGHLSLDDLLNSFLVVPVDIGMFTVTTPSQVSPLAEITVTAKKMSPPSSRETFEECIASASGGTSGEPADAATETLNNVGQAHAALETSVERLAAASAVNVGRAFGGTQAGLTAPSNAALTQYGTGIKLGLETATPYIKLAGYTLGAASILRGIQTGGVSGGLYATADFGIESALSGTGVGVAAAIAYDRAGGARTVARGFLAAGNLQACNTLAGSFSPSMTP